MRGCGAIGWTEGKAGGCMRSGAEVAVTGPAGAIVVTGVNPAGFLGGARGGGGGGTRPMRAIE